MTRSARRIVLSLLLAANFAAGVPAALAADTLVPHTATYKIRISIASGTLTTVVRESGEGFYVHSIIEPTGLAALLTSGNIEETSQFSVDDEGVRPLIYSSSDTLSSDNTFMHFTFDNEARIATGTVNDDVVEYRFEKELHDRVSIQYELMHNLMTGSPGTDYLLLEDDKLREITIRNVGTRRVKVPMGSFDAVGIQHVSHGKSTRITTLWCAEELGYLPVLIEQSRKGKDRFRAELIEYDPGVPGESSLRPDLSAGN